MLDRWHVGIKCVVLYQVQHEICSYADEIDLNHLNPTLNCNGATQWHTDTHTHKHIPDHDTSWRIMTDRLECFVHPCNLRASQKRLHVANNFKPSCNKLPQGEKWLLQISISRSSLCQWLLWWSICDKHAWSAFELWQRTPRQWKGREVKYDKVCFKVCSSRCREYRSALVPEKWGHDMSGLGSCWFGHWMSLVRLCQIGCIDIFLLDAAIGGAC